MSAKKLAPTVQPAPQVNPLNINYDRCNEHEIPDDYARDLVNRACGKGQGIAAIARILRANEAERQSQDADNFQGLNNADVTGLFEALVELSEDAYRAAGALGDVIIGATRKGK